MCFDINETKTVEHVDVTILTDGTVRIYGNGGLCFEIKGKYVRLTASLDPQRSKPPGEVKETTSVS